MKIYFDNVLIDQNYYKAISNDYHLFSDTFYLGSTACNTFTINIDKRAVLSQPILVSLRDNNDNLIANLVVDNIKESDDGSYIYTLTDKMVDFEFNYNASTIINSSATGKVSLYKILSDICNIAGIELGITSLENEVEVSWYDNTITARNYIGFIAELQGKYAYIDKNGKLNFESHKKTSAKTILFDELGDYKIGEYHKITRVVYEMGQIKHEFGDESNDTLYISADNPFIVNETQIEYIYNQIKDFEFYSFEVNRCIIDYSVRAGDVITFKKNNLEYPTIAQYSLTYNGGWSGGYSLNIKSKKQETTKNIGMSEEFKRLKIEVDRDMNSITQTVGSQIKEINSNLSTTNSNLSNLSDTVDTLSNDIDGVSADFEDFKDNEYIQSIDNLQKQIDGAIQFWNGAEIPTINNYPANGWTTENDKINHQADIYTVVQDVQGEMKQGKSYRFDKVNGVWQWIELTDNELSAVQALAQEALNKANANAAEIGTVKTRVSSLEQTDEQIKASVESIDKQIIPTASVSGSNIYIEDASDDPPIKLEIEGKSTQKTRSGKNLVDFGNPEYANYAAFTFVDDVLTITQNEQGTFSNISYNVLGIIKNNSGKTIKISYESIDITNFTSSNGLLIQLSIIDNGTNLYHNLLLRSGSTVPYTIPDDVSNMTYARIRMMTNNSSTIVESSSWSITKPMLIFDSENETYEAYGASPSPEFPSEIESVGYENLFPKFTPETKYGVTLTVNEDGTFNLKGTSTNTGNSGSKFAVDIPYNENKIISGKIYTVSSNVEMNEDMYVSIEHYNDATWVSNDFVFSSNKKSHTATITANANANCYKLAIRVTGGATVDLSNISLQLEEGEIAHPYIPYGKYGIEIKTVGKNLFEKDNANVFVASINITTTDYGLIKSSSNAKTFYIGVKPNTTYTISKILSKRFIIGTSEELPKVGVVLNNVSIFNAYTNATITTGVNDKYLAVYYFLNGTDTITEQEILDSIQIEEGNVSTEFEKYKSNKSVIPLNAPLRSLPNGVKDIAYIRNNKLYVDRYVGRVILNGSENWSTGNSGNSSNIKRFTLALTGSKPSLTTGLLSNYFLGRTTYGLDIEGINTNSSSVLSVYKDTNDLATFKNWLSNNNVQVDYELAEPYTEEIGTLEMLSTFKGVNHISTTDELQPTINLEYVRDTKLSNYVEGQINKVMTIEERHYSELLIENDSIRKSVEGVSSSVDGLNTTINRVEEITTDNSEVINIITTNIDINSGEVREVTTTTGFTFNADGMTIDDGSGFKAEHTASGTYYKDGDTITGQYTKDGSKQKDLELFGTYSYGKDSIDDTPMFIAQLYTDENGEECFGHFYNGGDY